MRVDEENKNLCLNIAQASKEIQEPDQSLISP